MDGTVIGLVTSVQRIMENVFMDALAHPPPGEDEDDANYLVIKNQLLPGLRSFCSALRGNMRPDSV